MTQDDLRRAMETVHAFRASPEGAVDGYSAAGQFAQLPIVRSQVHIDTYAEQPLRNDIDAIDLLRERLDRINAAAMRSAATIECPDQLAYRWRPIERVGVYVPWKLASTAMTFLSSARAAGVENILVYLAQDPGSGILDGLSVRVARHYGATIWGGPARFGFPALAFGLSGHAPYCDLVCGPCGASMNVLKQVSCLLAGAQADMSAGPSELAVVADESADWPQIAIDLASQLEHGRDSHATLLLVGSGAQQDWSSFLATRSVTLDSRISVRVEPAIAHAAEHVNKLGPETVEVWVRNAEALVRRLTACGVVYIRQASSLGDYGAIGRGCADPTNGRARAQSGLSPWTFLRLQAEVGEGPVPNALRRAALHLAEYEGLPAHGSAIIGYR